MNGKRFKAAMGIGVILALACGLTARGDTFTFREGLALASELGGGFYAGTDDNGVLSGVYSGFNMGGDYKIAIGQLGVGRGFMRFRLDALAGYTVESATLRLCRGYSWGGGYDSFANKTVNLYKIHASNADWVEGTSGWIENVDSRWAARKTGGNWLDSGGNSLADFGAGPLPYDTSTVLGSFMVNGTDVVGTEYIVTLTPAGVAAVNDWVNHPLQNAGFAIVSSELEAGGGLWAAASSEYAGQQGGDATWRPTMEITAILPVLSLDINNDGDVTNVSPTSATLRGVLVTNGGVQTAAYVCWGTTDGGVNKPGAGGMDWDVEALVSDDAASGTALSYDTGAVLASNTCYFYTYYASNSIDENWPDNGSLSFMTSPVGVETTADASTAGSNGLFRIFRHPDATNAAVTIRYVIGGTAVAGTHYKDTLGSNVTLAAGAASTLIEVRSLGYYEPSNKRTVTLTLLPPGPFIASAPGSAEMTITANAIPFREGLALPLKFSGAFYAGTDDNGVLSGLYSTYNMGSDYKISIGQYNVSMGFMRFRLDALAGNTVESATLRLRRGLSLGGGYDSFANKTVNLHKIYASNADWVEGTSGWIENVDSRWVARKTGGNWLDSGGNSLANFGTSPLPYDTNTVLGSFPVSGTDAVGTEYVVTLTPAGIAAVKDWVGNPLQNAGFAIVSSELEGLSRMDFASSEYAGQQGGDATWRPMLMVALRTISGTLFTIQ